MGVIGDGLNCLQAEQIGREIHKKLDNVPLAKANIRRKDSVLGFNDKINSVNIENKAVSINPTLLFTRLAALAGGYDNVEKFFDYELTSYPLSLFKAGMMRKPDKASLRNIVLTREIQMSSKTFSVVDGGSLLHQVEWPSGVTYDELISHYVSSVRRKYGYCHVIFDGYDNHSVKDHEHMRRTCQAKSKEIQFTDDMRVTTKRVAFLSNSKNKTLLIKKLEHKLKYDSQNVNVCPCDADTVALEVINICHVYVLL